MKNLKKLLEYKLGKIKSRYYDLRNIEYSVEDNVLSVFCEFNSCGYDHYKASSKDLDNDKELLIDLLKKEFKNVKTDYYDISFEIENYEDFLENVKKEIVAQYSEKWAIQIIKANNSSYYDEDIGMDIEFIEDIKVETLTFNSKEEAIVEYHLIKNSYESWDLVDIKLIKVIEE